MSRAVVAGVGLALVLASGTACTDQRTGRPAGESPAPGPPTPSATPSRCGSGITDPTVFHATEIAGPGGARLTTGVFSAPQSTVALVLLHQTGGAGLCGWAEFATLATREGFTSVAFDMCGYVDSTCPDSLIEDPATQVDLAADYARRELGIRRVVVVGASMGGSQAVRAVAHGARVEAWVDVSGPSSWDGEQLLGLAERVKRPGLVIYARSDGEAAYRKARELAKRTGATFLDGGSGHGWALLTGIDGRRLTGAGTRLLAFAGAAGTGPNSRLDSTEGP